MKGMTRLAKMVHSYNRVQSAVAANASQKYAGCQTSNSLEPALKVVCMLRIQCTRFGSLRIHTVQENLSNGKSGNSI